MPFTPLETPEQGEFRAKRPASFAPQGGLKTTNRSLLGAAADTVNEGVSAVGRAADYTGIPQAVGGAVGAVGGVIGGLLGGVGKFATNIYQGKPAFQDVGSAAIRTGKETAKFGYDIGKSGTEVAPLGVVGRVGSAAISGAQAYKAKEDFDTAIETGDTAAAVEAGISGATALLGARGALKGKGAILNSEVTGPIKNSVGGKFSKMFSRDIPKNADGVIKAISESETPIPNEPSKALEQAQQNAPQVNLVEKWSDISPDIKKRIQGKPEKLIEYFDVAEGRNLDDTFPTPLEYASKKVDDAQAKIIETLKDKGSEIGKFREEMGPVRIPSPKILSVMDKFDEHLSKLNLEHKGRYISQIKGEQSIVSQSEIKLLQRLRDNLRVLREKSNVEEVVLARQIFDDTINFAKSSREVSNVVDPIARDIRSSLAQINRETVGAKGSKMLEEYSDLLDVVKELNSYTKRKAGGEFLLKRVLSERGGQPKRLIELVKKYTGIDLLDDATMAQIATDVVGNSRQKGLFRQEITKAGLDVNSLLSGGPTNAIMVLLKHGKEKFLPAKKIFIKAAQSKK